MGVKPGGRRDEPLRAVLRELDDALRPTRDLAVTIEHHAGPESHQELTAASLDPDGALLQAAHTEVLRIDPRRLAVLERVSRPDFHNVHSAAPRPGGGMVVTATSTDRVLELDERHEIERDHALGDPPPGGDLRRLEHDVFEPHAVHPNHAAYVGDELWVTRFQDRCATSPTRRIELPEAMPHDGRYREGLLWFTQVTGRVVAVDPVSLRRELELDLTALSEDPRMPGWCRGIEVVGRRLFVGFTMLRRTRRREVLRMMARGIRGDKRPTRIVEVDLDTHRVVREVQVGNRAGGTIYAITAVP